jgi:hypothetical protein
MWSINAGRFDRLHVVTFKSRAGCTAELARRKSAAPTRSIGLTEAGERFLSRAKPAFEELVAASEAARDLGRRPAGLLRLSVPRAIASSVRTAWLTPSAAAARRKLRCWATLRNTSTPSSAPCLTVKFCFIAHQHYRE